MSSESNPLHQILFFHKAVNFIPIRQPPHFHDLGEDFSVVERPANIVAVHPPGVAEILGVKHIKQRPDVIGDFEFLSGVFRHVGVFFNAVIFVKGGIGIPKGQV